jgi:hypothetical protein
MTTVLIDTSAVSVGADERALDIVEARREMGVLVC